MFVPNLSPNLYTTPTFFSGTTIERCVLHDQTSIVPLNEFFTKGLKGLHTIFAELGNMYSQYILGRAHFYGIFQKDFKRAEQLLTDAVNQDYLEAIYKRSELFREIFVTAGDVEMKQRAWDELTDAAAKNHPYALFEWAVTTLKTAKSSSASLSNAINCLTTAANAGNEQAKSLLVEAKRLAEMEMQIRSIRAGGGDSHTARKREKEVFAWIERIALSGHGMAQYYLGFLYKHGIGTTPDPERAFYFFKKASRKNVAEAWLMLSSCYQWGRGTPIDKDEANRCLQKAADMGFSDAMWLLTHRNIIPDTVEGRLKKFILLRMAANLHHPDAIVEMGHLYLCGNEYVQKDERRALHYFRMADEQITQYQLTDSYIYGLGIQDNIQVAFELYRGETEGYQATLEKSRSLGCLHPMVCIANCYFEGKGEYKNIELARVYYEKAAKRNDPAGYWGLGMCGLITNQPTLSVSECVELITLAYKHGFFPAALTIGDLHRKGNYLEQNLVAAKKYYEVFLELVSNKWHRSFEPRKIELVRHAEMGLAEIYHRATHRLPKKIIEIYSRYLDWLSAKEKHVFALCLLETSKDPNDEKKAFDLYLSAAQEGHKPSYLPLADLFAKGKGTPKDSEKAALWKLKAAEGKAQSKSSAANKAKKNVAAQISHDASKAAAISKQEEKKAEDPLIKITEELSVKEGIKVETLNEGKRLCIRVSLQEKGSQRILEKIQACVNGLIKQKKSSVVKLNLENSQVLVITSTTTAGALDLFKINGESPFKKLKECLNKENKEIGSKEQVKKQEVAPSPDLQAKKIINSHLTDEQVGIIKRQLKKFNQHIDLKRGDNNTVILDFEKCFQGASDSYQLEIMGMHKITNQPEAVFEVPENLFKDEVILRFVKLYQGDKGKRPELKDHCISLVCNGVPDEEELNQVKDDMIIRLHFLKCKLLKKALTDANSVSLQGSSIDQEAADNENEGESLDTTNPMSSLQPSQSSVHIEDAKQKNNDNEDESDKITGFLENFLGNRNMGWLIHEPAKDKKKHFFSFNPLQVKTLSIDGEHIEPGAFFKWLATLTVKGIHLFKYKAHTCQLIISVEQISCLSDSNFKKESLAEFKQWMKGHLSLPPYLAENISEFQVYTKELDPVNASSQRLKLHYKFPLQAGNESLRFHASFLHPYLFKSLHQIAENEFRELQMHTMRFVHLFRDRYPRDRQFLTDLRTTFRHNPEADWGNDLNIFKTIILYGFHFLSYNSTPKIYQDFEQLIKAFNKSNSDTLDGLKYKPTLLCEYLAAEELRLSGFIEADQWHAALSSAAAIGELIQNDRDNNSRKELKRKGIKQCSLEEYEKLCMQIRREVGHESTISPTYHSFNHWAAATYPVLKSHFG